MPSRWGGAEMKCLRDFAPFWLCCCQVHLFYRTHLVLSGTACLVLTSGVLVLSLFAWHGHEKYNLLRVVGPRPIYLSLLWSVLILLQIKFEKRSALLDDMMLHAGDFKSRLKGSVISKQPHVCMYTCESWVTCALKQYRYDKFIWNKCCLSRTEIIWIQ